MTKLEAFSRFMIIEKPDDSEGQSRAGANNPIYQELMSALDALDSSRAIEVPLARFSKKNAVYLASIMKQKHPTYRLRYCKKNSNMVLWVNKI